MKADFYHLTLSPLEKILPIIAERVLARGERLLIVADDDGLLDRVDRLLWTFSADSFVPHARDDSAPIRLGQDVAPGYANLALIDGIWRDAALEFPRVLYFFDQETLAAARRAWRDLTTVAGVERSYWQQDEAGKWQLAA